MTRTSSRREFLKTASAGAAAAAALSASSYARIVGANERISIGLIGCGGRGVNAHMRGIAKHAKAENAVVTAVCDPWRLRRENAAAKAKEWFGVEARPYVSYRDVLSRADIDAVLIASCDHQHTAHLEATAKAKKDAYCEKPLAMDFAKLKSACDAVRAAKIVVQIGTQLRSYPTLSGCRKLFRTGVLGRISRIEQCRNGTRPYWYSRVKPAEAKDVDWKEFLPGLGSHFIDLVHYITGAKYPASSVCQGGTFIWRDARKFTCPDHVEATWIYPEGFLVHYSTNFGNGGGNSFTICGEHGTMDMVKWNAPVISSAGAIKKGTLGKETPVEPEERPDHFLNWLQCLRTRKAPIAPIEAGYQHAVAVIMAMTAYDTGRRQVYDAAKREIREG